MPRQKQEQGGIAPLVAARYAAQAAELVYDMLPDDAKEWVDENLGINWTKKNIIGPVVEGAMDTWKTITDPNYTKEKERERQLEEQEKRDEEDKARGDIWTCKIPDGDAYDCAAQANRDYLQRAPRPNSRIKDWYFKYDPRTGEPLDKWQTAAQLENSTYLHWNPSTKEWEQTAASEAAAAAEEQQAAINERYKNMTDEERRAQQETFNDSRAKYENEDWRRKNCKRDWTGKEECDYSQPLVDTAEMEQKQEMEDEMMKQYYPDEPSLQEEETQPQVNETETGSGWETYYGRKGFKAGLGGDRPFNAVNKPTLNINRNAYNALMSRDLIPTYYQNNPKQIVLWNSVMDKPLAPDQQEVNGVKLAKQRVKKREKVLAAYDQKDIYTKRKSADEAGMYGVRGQRRPRNLTRNQLYEQNRRYYDGDDWINMD